MVYNRSYKNVLHALSHSEHNPDGGLSLISDLNKRHSPTKARLYFSAVTAVLSVFLAVLLLYSYVEWPLLYLRYFSSTFVITTVAYLLRIRLFKVGEGELQKKDPNKIEESHAPWKGLIAIFLALLAFLFVPILLATILDPKSWFILIASLTSGMSIAEILLCIRTR